MKNFFVKKFVKKIIFAFILFYVVYTFISQQKILNSYSATKDYYKEQIEEQMKYAEKLKKNKDNINSEEYIEEIAREKLDMYLPNERVYVDNGN